MTPRAEVAAVGVLGGAVGVGLAYALWYGVLNPPAPQHRTTSQTTHPTTSSPPASSSPPSSTASPTYTYTVQTGDTLSAIAACAGTTVEALATLNHITNVNVIYPGTVLQLPNPLSPHCRIQPTCDPMSMACLLDYAVGHIPVSHPAAWVPAQQAARLVYGSGQDLFALTHHPVGYFGSGLIPAQHAADYLLSIGIDPCPPAIYTALQVASATTGVPLPILLGTAYTESRFLQYGHVANAALVNPATGATGLMQMTPIAVAQVQQSFPKEAQAEGITWATVQANYTTNALAAAWLLRYLATQEGVPYDSVDYAAWQPVMVRYGEGGAAATTISQAASSTFVAANTPYHAQVKQYTAGVRATKPQVTCTYHFIGAPQGIVTVQTCTNGTTRVVAGPGVS